MSRGDAALDVTVDEDFLIVEAPVDPIEPGTPWWVLAALNARLPAPAKLLLDRHGAAVRVRVELGRSDVTPERRVRAEGAVRAAVLAVRGIEDGGGEPGAVTAPGDSPSWADGVAACLAEAGWPATRLASGLSVDLGRNGSRAHVAPGPDATTVAIRVDLDPVEAPSETVRAALGLLLLRAAGHVRLVRPSVVGAGRRWHPRLEAWCALPPSTEGVDAACGALATACRWYAAELAAVREEVIARTYVAMCGGPALAVDARADEPDTQGGDG